MKNKISKKALAIVSAGMVAALSLGAYGGATLFSHEKLVEVEKPVDRIIEVEKIVEVPVEVVKTETITVPVDNEKLGMIMQYIVDENGDLSELDISEIDDEGVAELIAQVDFIQQSKLMAADFVAHELADEIDGMSFIGVTFDEDDIERVKVKNELDEMSIEDIDFEDGDADVEVLVNFEHDNIKYVATVNVEIKDNQIDDLEIVSVDLR